MRIFITCFLIWCSFLCAFSNQHDLASNKQQDSISHNVNTQFVDSRPENGNSNTNDNTTDYDILVKILSVAIAILAAVVAINGQRKSNLVDKIKEDFDNFYDNLQNDLKDINQSILQESQSTTRLSQILQKQNESLYNSLLVIAKENKSNDISRAILHNYHINLLYISCLSYDNEESSQISLFDTFSFLKENGTKEDITHLKYVAKNNPNKNDRSQAEETIGYIKNRPK